MHVQDAGHQEVMSATFPLVFTRLQETREKSKLMIDYSSCLATADDSPDTGSVHTERALL